MGKRLQVETHTQERLHGRYDHGHAQTKSIDHEVCSGTWNIFGTLLLIK